MRAPISIVVLGLVLAVAPSFADRNATGRLSIDISGSYTSNWGAVTLRQNGNKITGSYVWSNGQLDGVLDGNLLRYSWHESDGSGHGVWVVATNGELIGTWGTGASDISGGGWRLTPIGRAVAIAN